ncbi:MAG: Trk system potassium transporter TrkA [Cyclobacteriaceae bacterium]
MRIIIAGAGDVGFHLAKLLAIEEHDINIIDIDTEKLQYISNHLDVNTIRGNSTSFKILEEAKISKVDLLITVTESESTNISTAIIGKNLGAKKTIARISNTEFLHKKDVLNLKDIGIDEIISPESLAAKEIKRLLKDTALTDAFEFEKGILSLVGVTIDEDSELLNQSLADTAYLNPERNFNTVAILRDNETIIPHGENIFKLNDHAYFITQPDGMERVRSLSGKTRTDVKNMMILGGSKIGIQTAMQLSNKYKIKLIEQDKEKCFELADKLENTLIINGDGRDLDLLQEEGIQNMDAFIAVTGNSETNIISSLVAKDNNVKKTIALVENIDYIHLSQNIGVDTMINKKLIAASFIFRHIRKGEVLNLTNVHGVDGEILEFEVKPKSKILDVAIKDLQFPRAAIIGGVIRNNKGITVRGNFVFQEKDRVVVLSKPECIHTVEGFFK